MSTKSKKKSKQSQEGICKLTGSPGKFANAHILPRALTRLSRSGEKAIETSLGARPLNRPQTWYDNSLVIQEGEKILESIDTPAIAALRKHKLVWSAFNCDAPFGPDDLIQIDSSLALRQVDISSAEQIRLFFLSVVWRAAASSRPEFAHVLIADEILEDLRQRVLTKEVGNVWDYPMVLDQLITRGLAQNRTPLVEQLSFDVDGMDSPISLNTVRIYMDGLVAKVIFAKEAAFDLKHAGKIILGASSYTLVYSRTFEQSRTRENMLEVISDNARRGYR